MFTFEIRQIVERADRKERNVWDVDDFQVVRAVVMNHRRVVRFFFRRWVVGRFKGAFHELLEAGRKKNRDDL